jgi:starvation-inducible DNA-binding protein
MPTKNLEKGMYTTSIDIPETTRKVEIELLNKTLASTLDLWSQIKQAHWNVKGMNFYQLHILFDEIAKVVYEYIDMVAERVTALGGEAHGTVRHSANKSILPEYPALPISEKDHIIALAERLAAYGKHIREGIAKTNELNEPTTNDLYIEISREIDAKLWFIEAHLQGMDR